MDLSFLRPLYERPGPDYVSVYADTSRHSEDAARMVQVRWHELSAGLTADGADAATVRAIAAVITDPAAAAPGRAVFGRAGEVLLTEALPAPPRREIARLAPLPHVMPMLAQGPPLVPHLRVTATLAGGQVLSAGRGGSRERDVGPGAWPVHKTRSGGWSQARHQRSAEHAWQENAQSLAGQVIEAARRIGAERIIVAGDVRARSLLLGELPQSLRDITTTVDREIAADSQELAEISDRLLASDRAQQARSRFGHWQALQTRSLAAEGLIPATTALSAGLVSDLFLADDPSSTTRAWIGPGGADLAMSPDGLDGRGIAAPRHDRADAAIARALAMTDAQLWILPGAGAADDAEAGPGNGAWPDQEDQQPPRPADGVAATLRAPLDWPAGQQPAGSS